MSHDAAGHDVMVKWQLRGSSAVRNWEETSAASLLLWEAAGLALNTMAPHSTSLSLKASITSLSDAKTAVGLSATRTHVRNSLWST